ncbi:MAG: hypothetical protein ACJA1A_003596 [Saprospiraceae bacterium]|jgi:hypothetical protein
MTNQDLHNDVLTECKYDISMLDFDNVVLSPSVTIKFNHSLNSFLKIGFPAPNDSFSRFDQYQFMSDYVSVINFSNLSLVSYLQFTCGEDLSVDSALWNTECFMALVGTMSAAEIKIQKEEEECVLAIVFNNINGELVSSEIKEADKWESLVNNTEVFRDILYSGLYSNSSKEVYRWDVIHKMLIHYGFTLDYSDDIGEDHFLISQNPIFV